MTNDEINIQAAKALGWKVNLDSDYESCHSIAINDDLRKLLDLNDWNGNFIYFRSSGVNNYPLKFTKSYDWAWLLVKRIVDDDTDNIYELFINELLFEHLKILDPMRALLASPKQISLAALEVLK